MDVTTRREQVADAVAARDEGIETAQYAADPRIIVAIDTAIANANKAGLPWSANDIRDQLPVSHRGLVGSRVRAAMMRRHDGRPEMVWVGEEPSTLRSTHAKPIARWLGFDAWAAANPAAAAEYLSPTS